MASVNQRRWRGHLRLTRRIVMFVWSAPWKDGSDRRLRSVGVSLAIPWRGEWLRPHFAVIFGRDSGMASLSFEAVFWRATRQRLSATHGDRGERAYVRNTKRYARVVFRSRYRPRRDAELAAQASRRSRARRAWRRDSRR